MTALSLSGLNLEGTEYAAYTAASVVGAVRICLDCFSAPAESCPMIGAALTLMLPVIQCRQRHLSLCHTRKPSA